MHWWFNLIVFPWKKKNFRPIKRRFQFMRFFFLLFLILYSFEFSFAFTFMERKNSHSRHLYKLFNRNWELLLINCDFYQLDSAWQKHLLFGFYEAIFSLSLIIIIFRFMNKLINKYEKFFCSINYFTIDENKWTFFFLSEKI